MRHLSCHFTPCPFPFTPGKQLCTYIQFLHHLIVFLNKITDLILPVPNNFFISRFKIDLFHLVTYKRERVSNSVGDKECNDTSYQKNERIKVNNRDKEI